MTDTIDLRGDPSSPECGALYYRHDFPGGQLEVAQTRGALALEGTDLDLGALTVELHGPKPGETGTSSLLSTFPVIDVSPDSYDSRRAAIEAEKREQP